MAPLRLALIGESGSGKSEAARIIASEYGCTIIKTGQICREISRLLFGNENKASTQVLDDALTTIDGSIFLRASLRGATPDAPLVIDSLRFVSDLELARSLGFKVVRVTAPVSLRLERLRQRGQVFDWTKDGVHRSETELRDVSVDASIHNAGSREELAISARAAADSLL